VAVYFATPEDAMEAAAEKVKVDGNLLRSKFAGVVGRFRWLNEWQYVYHTVSSSSFTMMIVGPIYNIL